MVRWLAPHLGGMMFEPRLIPCGLFLQQLLPAAAQLERACPEVFIPDISVLGQLYMLKGLCVTVKVLFQLTAPLPWLHTLGLRFLAHC